MLNYPDGTASLQLNPLPPAMTVAGVNNQLVENRSQYQQAMMTRSASNPEYGRNLYKPFHQIQLGLSNFDAYFNRPAGTVINSSQWHVLDLITLVW